MPVTPTGGELHINTNTADEQSTASVQSTQRRPIKAVAMDPNGGFVVVWSSQGQDEPASPIGWGVYAQRYDKTGSPIGTEFLVNTRISGDQLSPSVAIDATGNFAITWTSTPASPADTSAAGVFVQRYDKDGLALGGETLVNTYKFDNQQNSTIAMNAAGDYVITWSSELQDQDGWGVYAQQYNADGTKKGTELAINPRSAADFNSVAVLGDQQSSSVAIAPDGSFVVVWESNAQDGDGWGIYAKRYNAAGVAQGNEFIVNTTTARSQRNPSVAIDTSGNFVVSWTSDNGLIEGQEVYVRRFGADGTAQTGEIKVNVNPFGDQQYSTVTTLPVSTNVPLGGFVVTWSSSSGETTGGGGNGVFLKRYSASGVPLEEEIQVNTFVSNDQFFSSAASDKDGNLAVVWTSQSQTGDPAGGIYGQRFVATANVNAAPTNLAIAPASLNENVAINAIVGTFTTTDPNPGDSFTYTLVAGDGATDNAAFSIVGGQLRINASPNFEAQSSYSIRVKTTDSGGLFFEKALNITINDVNEPSTDLSLSITSIDENIPANTAIGTLSTVDPDTNDSFTYTLIAGTGATDNARFSIAGNALTLLESPNFESKPSYSIRVQSIDLGGFIVEKVLTIAVNNITEAPTDLALSPSAIDENQPGGAVVGLFSSVDPDGPGSFTYTLVTGTGSTDNAAFTISASGQLLITASPDYEVKPSYAIRVRTTDSSGLFFEKELAIVVNDLNEAPTNILLAPDNIDENVPGNSLIGNLATTDPDPGNTFTYTLVTGTGSTDNAAFTLSTAGALNIISSPNFEAKPTYSIRVRTTDGAGASFEKALTVTINDLAEAPGNLAPTDLNLAPTSIAENTGDNAAVGTFTTTDPNTGDTFTYTLVTGTGDTDNAEFAIVGNQLQIISSPNFETKPTYAIRVRTRDAGGLNFEKALTIAITDVNETPTDVALSSLVVPENVPDASAVGTFTTTDPDTGNTFTYSLVTGTGDTDNAAFTIVGNQLQINTSPNFEAKSTYSIRVRSTDTGTLSTEKILTISVADLNEAPTAINPPATGVDENIVPGFSVGNLQAIDEDANENHTYKLVTGAGDTDNGVFTLTSAGQLIINVSPDYETKPSYSIRVETTDKGGLKFTQAVIIGVNDVPEDGSPTNLLISNSDIPENGSPNALIGQFTTTDPDSTAFTYSLVSGFGDNAAFTIGGTNNDQLFLTNAADFETLPSYSIKVRTTDDTGRSLDKILTINVTNVNEAPTNLSLSNVVLDENVINPIVGLLTSTDPDIGDAFVNTLVPGFGDNAAFTIVGNQLRINTPPNFEAKPTYSIRITSTDTGGLSVTKDFAITINNLPEAPIDLTLSATSIDENKPIGTVVGTLTTTDDDLGDTHTYSLVAGTGSTDNATFEIVGTELRIKAIPDFETKPAYSIRLRTTDSTGRFFDKVVPILVNDLSEGAGTTIPQDLLLSKSDVDENQPIDTAVGSFSTVDPDSGEVFTYSLVTGTGATDNAAFTIVNNELRLAAIPDFEAKSSYSIRVRTTDKGGLFFEKVFAIAVNNLPELPGQTAPTDLALSKTDIDENQPVGTIVGTLSTVDPDAGDTFTYSLVLGDGSDDNATFAIVNNELRLNSIADFESQQTYKIRLRSTDVGGKFFDKVFTIAVNNLPELPGQTAPTDLALSKTDIDENQPASTVVGSFSTTDPDVGDTFTYTLVSGSGSTDNAAFAIVNGALQINGIPDFETKATYSIRVRSTDVGGKFAERVFTITVNNLLETPGSTAPQDLLLSQTNVDENRPIGTAVGTFTTQDPDPGDTFTYSLVTGTGSTDNTAFTLVNNELRLNVVPDFETKTSYSIRVRSTDVGGKFFEKVFTIGINNLPENPGDTLPTDLLLSNGTVAENVPPNTIVGSFSTIDPDVGDSFTYKLVNGFGDNAAFTIVGNQLQINSSPNFEAKSSYSIQVTTSDIGGKSFTKTFTVGVQDVNEAPVITPSAGTLSYSEGSGAVRIDTGLKVTDIDSLSLTGATATLAGYVPGQDGLGFSNTAKITGSFDAVTGSLTLSGTATIAEYEAALQSITYANSSSNPSSASRTVRFTATDGSNISSIATRSIQIIPTNTAPVIATSVSGLSYTENSGAIALDPNVTVSDIDSPTLAGATIALDSYVAQQDVLSFTSQNGITANFNPTTGVLTLSGIASLANYQLALQSVKYTNTSSNPTTSDRTARLSVTDGTATSNIATRTIQILPINSAPIVTPSPSALSYTENSSPIAIDPGILVSDADSAILAGATIAISGYIAGQDSLSFSNFKGVTGSFNSTTGILTLGGLAAVADYQTALRSIIYTNVGDNPSSANRTLSFTVTDGIATSNPVTRTLQITTVNDAPIATTSVKTVTFPRSAGALTLDANLSLTDADSPNLAGASVVLGGYVAGEDGLIFNDQNGITGSFNATTATLTLTGSASVASYQAALRSLIYTNNSDSSVIGTRNVEISVTDGIASSNPATGRLQIQFDKSDTVPTLDLNGSGVGRDFSNTFVIAGSPVAIADSSAQLTDSDSTTLTSAQVIISNLFDGSSEELLVDTIGTGIKTSYNAAKGALSLTGAASPATYLKVLRSIRYQNRSANPDRTTRIILFSVNDGTNSSEPAQTAIQITQINLSEALLRGQSLVTTIATDLINAPSSNDTVTSTLANLQQNDQIDGGGGFDTLVLTDGGGSALVDVRNSVNQVRGILEGITALTNFEYFDFGGFQGNVTLQGSDALDDRLTSGSGNDSLTGGGGSDRLIGNGGNDTLDGGSGMDRLEGGTGDDTYIVDSPNDTLVEGTEAGFDIVYASASWTIGAELEDLILTGGAIVGTGNDLSNKITGNALNNTLTGNSGNDILEGNSGNDALTGGDGGDRLFGGNSNDTLNGGSSNDILVGGLGRDLLTGGTGKDRFWLTRSRKGDADKITDFRAIDDTICISQKGFSQRLNRGTIAADRFVLGSQAKDEGDRFIYSKSTGALFFDADGSGGKAQVQIAQLTNRAAMTRSDIFIIS